MGSGTTGASAPTIRSSKSARLRPCSLCKRWQGLSDPWVRHGQRDITTFHEDSLIRVRSTFGLSLVLCGRISSPCCYRRFARLREGHLVTERCGQKIDERFSPRLWPWPVPPLSGVRR